MVKHLKNKTFYQLVVLSLLLPNWGLANEKSPKGCAKWPYQKIMLSAQPYVAHIEKEIHQKPVTKELVIAVITAESCFKTDALSHAGAQGLMQLIPATAKRFGVTNRLNARENIKGGIGYLNFLSNKFQNIEHVIAGYNAGEGAVMKYNGVPRYRETKQYLINVLHVYKRLLRNKPKQSRTVHTDKAIQNLPGSTRSVDQVDTEIISPANSFGKWKVLPMKAALNGFK
jgi:soluble lytic murein transglycosylase-like protein